MKLKLSVTALLIIILCCTVQAQPKYDLDKMQLENLGRGLVAIRENHSTVVVSWRYLSSDPIETGFNVYRDGEKLNKVPLVKNTMFFDKNKNTRSALYEVRAVVNGVETGNKNGTYTLPENAPHGYINIPIKKAEEGVTLSGEKYTYYPSDATVADVTGDGEYEIIIKLDPTNRKDNSLDGYTGNVYVDCYKITGEFLWRIDLGKNIRAGSHYTQILAYDFDGDGKAEVILRTSDGTVDGKGNVIGDPNADYREEGTWVTPRKRKTDTEPRPAELKYQGRIISGPEYITVFSGETGEALYTTDYIPVRGDVNDWGDERGNRSDRFLACVAYLDGVRPSAVLCRGYYTRTVLAAFDWDGKTLSNRWVFDSNEPGNEDYAGQGNHNLRVADVDGDGCDEIVYGSCTINNDGTGLYSTRLGHGDAIHLTQFSPDDSRFQVWDCHENGIDGSTFRDAATGEIIFQIPDSSDVGRCMAADIDPTNPGLEMWSTASGGIRNIKGEVIAPRPRSLPINMAVWWDGDLLREMLNKIIVSKYDWTENRCVTITKFDGSRSVNGTKATPCLHADIIGDWREEVLMCSQDDTAIRLYVSPIPTDYRFHTFMEEPVYRLSVATQNVGYNQPTQPGFYFGNDMPKGIFRGYEFK